MSSQTQQIARRLEAEEGTLFGHGRRQVALVYPSPYAVGMSSLGFQQVYRLLNALPDTVAERAFRPDAGGDEPREPVLTYESRRPIGDFPVVALSVAYEGELVGVLEVLSRSGIPLLASERRERDPFVVAGGPLTFSNPLPLAPFADVIVLGEAEDLLGTLCDVLFSGSSRSEALRELASRTGFFVPVQHGTEVGELARASDDSIPARGILRSPEASLSSMALVEAERGCSRGCTFCVMRRSAGRGMRVVPPERVLAAVPAAAHRVGLVGAAVTDHPRIAAIAGALVERGCEVGLSSLRADRLTPELVDVLVRGGARNLTIAADGASERLRESMEKKIRAEHLLAAARMAGERGLAQLKCYAMLGVPGETDADVDELAALGRGLAEAAGPRVKVVLGVSTFVPKLRTPLAREPFAGIPIATARLSRLKRAVGPRVEVRGDSARWAWVEYVLAQGGPEAGLRAMEAWRNGGGLTAFRRAFAAFDEERARALAGGGAPAGSW